MNSLLLGGNEISNRRKTINDIAKEFEVTIPGNVPSQPKHDERFHCDCEQCVDYKGTYTINDDEECFDTPELTQE